ncbi:MAG TPA: cbb3-type cytochrome c oxidase subunit I, partial [Cyclobacteriaceae bacterium]|nr:cbb3-type cytochrome c oxidase subunit I [Cyclobacteriaceae bacterium]
MRKFFDYNSDVHIRFRMRPGRILMMAIALFMATPIWAQSTVSTENWLTSPGIIGTFFLIAIVVIIAIVIMLFQVGSYIKMLRAKKIRIQRQALAEEIIGLPESDIDELLLKRKQAIKFKLIGEELGSSQSASDNRGLVHRVIHDPGNPLVDEKKKSSLTFETPDELKKIILFFLGASVFWLVFGTLVGQYVGMKFVWPDMDHIAWLSFGRLRPVHTNTVFWGWASLAMIGLGYLVIARTSNTKI